jgi:hypothetical protein
MRYYNCLLSNWFEIESFTLPGSKILTGENLKVLIAVFVPKDNRGQTFANRTKLGLSFQFLKKV